MEVVNHHDEPPPKLRSWVSPKLRSWVSQSRYW
jgi:hypothetical protein